MKSEYLIYHENNLEKPYIPQEDAYAVSDNVFVVADGITHDLIDNLYPDPSDSAKVASIICETIISELAESKREQDDIKKAIQLANRNVAEFNKTRSLFLNKESNGYTIGAAVFATVVIKEGRLLYAVLDDCFFSIFSEDLVDHPTLKSYVETSAQEYDSKYDWAKPADRKVWRKNYRNNKLHIGGKELGYGAIDGTEGFEQFVQYGEEYLKPGDLVCLYTDGFIKIMKDLEFVKKVKEAQFSINTLGEISEYTKANNITKEKTCIFIKWS